MLGQYLIDFNLVGFIFYGLFNDVDGSSYHIMLILGLTVSSEVMWGCRVDVYVSDIMFLNICTVLE
jgi:hypothetical protein